MAGINSSCTPEQMETLLSFLDDHKDLARGRLRNVEGRVQSRRLWEQITANLNALGGSTKTVQQWQKLWTDRKYLAKKAAAALRSEHQGTGGGPSSASPLSQTEEKIMAIMGEGFGEPQTSASVPAFNTNNDLENITPITIDTDGPITVNHPTSEPSASRQPLRSLNRNRRVRTADDSVRGRFFRLEERRLQLEEEKIAQMAGIKSAVEEVGNLLRSLREDLNSE